MDIKKFRKLCVKSITRNIDETEKKVLNNWLAQSKENKDEYERIESVWKASVLNEIKKLPDVDLEWEYLSERISVFDKEKVEEKVKEKMSEKILAFTKSLFAPKWKPAFAGLLIVVFSVILFLVLQNKEIPQYNKISTENKEHRTVQLPDGSTAYLNSGSTIEFPNNFYDEERKIKLEGEAFFSVTKNRRPFVITTENAKITVLGTKFNVWTRDEKTKVVVKEGCVNFEQIKAKNENVILVKGQLSTITKNSVPSTPENVNAGYLLGWMNNKLVFNRTTLNEIAGELERFYNIRIKFEDDNLKDLTLTGSFDNQKVDGVLSMICLALNLEYDKTDKSDGHEQESYAIKLKK